MKLLFALCLVLLGHLLFSQKILVLNDGTAIEYKKVKLKGDVVMVKPSNGKNMEIPGHSIERREDIHDRSTRYLRPCENCLGGASELGKVKVMSDYTLGGSSRYAFMELDLEGEAKLFKRSEYTSSYAGAGPPMAGGLPGPGIYTSTSNHLNFIQRDTTFALLFGTESKKNRMAKRRERLDFMKNSFEDDSIIVDKVSDSDFLGNYASIRILLNEYNVRTFSLDDKETTLGQVTFLRTLKEQVDQPVAISINGELVHKGLMPEFMTTLDLSSNKPSKVCFNDYCELITASAYYTKVIDIKYKGKAVGYKLNTLEGEEARH
ncbi:MAG: hypothetical protein AAF391_00005, partial [Bacteroidota bacterium]